MRRPLWGSFGTEYGGLFGAPLERDVKAFGDSCRTEYRGLFWIFVGQTSRASWVYLSGTEYEGLFTIHEELNTKANVGLLLETMRRPVSDLCVTKCMGLLYLCRT